MSKEILHKVRETETLIESMKQDVEEVKDQIDMQKTEEIERLKQDLAAQLKGFEAEQSNLNNQKVDEASEEINQETEEYRVRLDRTYNEIKDQITDLGVREVLNEYGNFGNEESSIHS